MDMHSIRNRCQYRNCKNGKHNNSKLFNIPLNLDRQKLWIDCTGNYSLLKLKQESIHARCICYTHFRKKDIVSGKLGLRLERNAKPFHWMEIVDDDERLDRETMLTLSKPQERATTMQHEDLQVENGMSTSGNNFPIITNTTKSQEKEAEMRHEDLQVENDISTSDNEKDIICEKSTNHCTTECRILNMTLQNQVKRLEEENNNLKMILKKIKKKCANVQYKNKQLIAKKSKKFCIDEFLQKNNVNHLSQTMIKLQLHKSNSIFTKDERDLAKQLYQNSPSAYCRLRDSGLNLPSSSIVRRWIAEIEVCPDM